MRNFTRSQKFHAFLFSYSGAIAVIGVIMLYSLILCSLLIDDKESKVYRIFDDVITPIFMSVIASVIFYFLSFYFPNVRRNEVEAEEIDQHFLRLQKLNKHSLISLGLSAYSLWEEDDFKQPSYDEIDILSKGIILREKPYIDCWKNDDIYIKIKDSKNWTSFFSVILDEQHKILETISTKVNLHPTVKESILALKGSFGLDFYLDSLRDIELQESGENQMDHSENLKCMMLLFCDHIENLINIEYKYHQSIYRPL